MSLSRVLNYAAGPSGPMNAVVEAWRDDTLLVLRGNRNLRLDDWKQCPVGKALQVLLLRPQPEQFAKWLQDVPGIPPAVWFTGATLCGYLHGYRRLPTSFRGTALQRQMLAIHALKLTSNSLGPVDWPFPDAAQLTWRRDEQDVVLMCGTFEIARKAAHPRTLWYIADFNDAVVGNAARELARRLDWHCSTHRVNLANSFIPFTSHPNAKVSIESGPVAVQGIVDFEFPTTAHITQTFDQAAFRRCVAVEGGPITQPPPVKERARNLDLVSRQPAQNDRQLHAHPVIHGLSWLENFLTPQEESDLVAQIDAAAWLDDLSRRVQHYGWRYDYKSRKISTDMRLGPLPPWAAQLAERLAREKLLPHVPDQVIVNEYIGKQGISKHVDCKPCFEDGIAMISLLESWEMIFSKGRIVKRQQVLLPQRSVCLLKGEARYDWTHEIPKRLTEPSGFQRKRRLSITLRKVVLDTASDRAAKGKRGAHDSDSNGSLHSH